MQSDFRTKLEPPFGNHCLEFLSDGCEAGVKRKKDRSGRFVTKERQFQRPSGRIQNIAVEILNLSLPLRDKGGV